LFERKLVTKEYSGTTNLNEQTGNNLVEDDYIYGRELNQESFSRLYDNYFPRLYRYVAYRTGNREEAEDMVGLVFEKILDKYHTFNPQRGNLDAWIFRIAHNALANRLRTISRHPQQFLDDTLELDSGLVLSELVVEREELQQLRHYLTKLSDKERELLALRFGAGLPHRRIGELMGMNEGNVTVTLGRIVRKLRGFFEAEDNER
jgi:RNA polymerase sigma-70 factor (ECF subfamily)